MSEQFTYPDPGWSQQMNRRAMAQNFIPLDPKEKEALAWDTPYVIGKEGAWADTPRERRQQMDEMMNRTQEELDRQYQELTEQGMRTIPANPLPAGRLRGHKNLPAIKEYLQNPPDDVTIYDMGDDTVIIRKKTKPAALTS